MKDESANLDLLRATAVSIVLVFHTLLFWDLEHIGGLSIRPLGHFGVLLFFVHTTLVLMFSMRRQQTQQPEKPLFSPFMIRRIFRIYPLSVVMVGSILLFHIPQTKLAPHSLSWTAMPATGWALNFLLMQNLARTPSVPGPLWSLPFEMQMYTVLPILFLCANRSKSAKAVLGIWCAAVALYWTSTLMPVAYFSDLIVYAPNFIPGVIAYRLASSERRIAHSWWPVFLGLLIAGFVLSSNLYAAGETYLGWAACLLLGLAIPFFKELPPGRVRQGAHLIAKYSYGIYLSHYFALWFAFIYAARAPLALRWCIFATLVVAVPVVMFHTIESPMIKLGNRVVRNLVRWMPDVATRSPLRASGGSAIAVASPES